MDFPFMMLKPFFDSITRIDQNLARVAEELKKLTEEVASLRSQMADHPEKH